MVAADGNERTYSPDMEPYPHSSPPGSTGLYAAAETIPPTTREDPRHASIQYSVISEVDAEPSRSYFPPATPVSPYERAHLYHGQQDQQY